MRPRLKCYGLPSQTFSSVQGRWDCDAGERFRIVRLSLELPSKREYDRLVA